MAESVLLVGSGGREHAMAEAMAGSPDLDYLYCAPGNTGTAELDIAENVPFGPADTPEIVNFARSFGDEMTVVVGPEAPLVAGLGDALRAEGATVFGPNRAAARIEGSKVFASYFMDHYGIPQPESRVATNIDEALRALDGRDPQDVVLKADKLAGGKGVVLPADEAELRDTLYMMLSGEGFGGAGKDGLVIQERLHGPELSVFVLCDGRDFSVIPFFAQDHKRRDDGDQGPNTGGMGAYAPVSAGMMTSRQLTLINAIAGRTVYGMEDLGSPYQGVLFMGLMLAEEKGGDPVVIEDNCRFGDPETQVMLPLLSESGVDVYQMLRDTARGTVPDLGVPQFTGRAALTVCLAADGYPDNPRPGDVIHGLDGHYEGVTVHHGSTRRDGDEIVTAGGRVLYVTGKGESVDAAAGAAYKAIGANGIHFAGMHYRTDIGHQARTAG